MPNENQDKNEIQSGCNSNFNQVDSQSFNKVSILNNEKKYDSTNNIQNSNMIENVSNFFTSSTQMNFMHLVLSNLKKLNHRLDCGKYM